MLKRLPTVGAALIVISCLSGCQSTGQQYAGNVYKADQVNTTQQAKTVQILAVMPAKIEVENTQAKETGQLVGGVLGAIGGAAVGNKTSNGRTSGISAGTAGGGVLGAVAGSTAVNDKVLVDGVSLTYVDEGKTLNSAQVGKMCEFVPGIAVVISSKQNETRIQPNSTCPEKGE